MKPRFIIGQVERIEAREYVVLAGPDPLNVPVVEFWLHGTEFCAAVRGMMAPLALQFLATAKARGGDASMADMAFGMIQGISWSAITGAIVTQ